jgi:hypothetical protein
MCFICVLWLFVCFCLCVFVLWPVLLSLLICRSWLVVESIHLFLGVMLWVGVCFVVDL